MILFGLVSEVGSVATYVGFVTAGVAVALQNVILAVVAYFFLIGRYGVKVGDRITLAGVTGRVVDSDGQVVGGAFSGNRGGRSRAPCQIPI